MDNRHADFGFEYVFILVGLGQEAESKKKCRTPLFISALLIIVDKHMKIHHVHKKQVTVKFYQAINFTCNAEEPICRHSGNQNWNRSLCSLFCF